METDLWVCRWCLWRSFRRGLLEKGAHSEFGQHISTGYGPVLSAGVWFSVCVWGGQSTGIHFFFLSQFLKTVTTYVWVWAHAYFSICVNNGERGAVSSLLGCELQRMKPDLVQQVLYLLRHPRDLPTKDTMWTAASHLCCHGFSIMMVCIVQKRAKINLLLQDTFFKYFVMEMRKVTGTDV